MSKIESNIILDIDKEDEDSNPKIFFTSDSERHAEEVFISVIPKRRHKESDCVAAKKKELENFDEYDVYDIVDKPKDAHLINTEWVIVEKEDEKGGKIIKARLCMRGDLEKNKHLIPTDSPTINRTTLRLMLAIANC